MPVTFFAPISSMIALDTGHAQYASYVARWQAICNDISIVGGGQTYAGFVSAFDALTAEQKVNVLTNLEAPWLAMLEAKTNATPSTSWHSGGTYATMVQDESTRQGAGTINGSTPMSTYKAIAERLWQDVATYALANGASNVFHYSTPGWSIGSGANGVPYEGVRNSATRDYWQNGGGNLTHEEAADATIDANGQLPSLMRAHRGATADALGWYSPWPDGTDYAESLAAWEAFDAACVRKNSAGTTQSPDFAAGMLSEWEKATTASMPYHYRRVRDDAATADPLLADDAERDVAIVVRLSPQTPDLSEGPFSQRNHFTGRFDSSPVDRAAKVVGAIFRAADADTPNVRSPEHVIIFESARYFWSNVPTLTRSSQTATIQKGMDQLRHAYEVKFFGRAQLAGDDPTGEASPSPTHDSFFQTNNLGDTLWSAANSTVVWRNASGVLHANIVAAGLTIDFDDETADLAPYFTAQQIAGTAAITQADVRNAIELYVTEYLTQAGEEAARLIAVANDIGDGALVQVYSSTAGFEPYDGIKIGTRSGSMRDAEIGEEINVIAAGATPEKWVLCADGIWRQYATGGGGGVTDGDKGDIVVSGTGTVWTIDASAVTNGKLASGAVTGAKMSGSGASADFVWIYNGSAWAPGQLDSGQVTDGSTLGEATVTDALDALNSGKSNVGHTHVPADVTMTNGYAVLGRSTGTGGSTTELVPGSSYKIVAYDGSSTGFKEIDNNYIASGAGILYSKMEAVAAYSFLVRATGTSGAPDQIAVSTSQLIGRGSSGNVSAITLGSGLSMSGTTLSATATGDVVGPASATDNAIARFDLATGKLIQDSTVTVSDTGAVSGVSSITFTSPGYSIANDGSHTGSAIFEDDLTVNGVLTITDLAGLRLTDTDGSHRLIIAAGSNLTANRTLTLTTGDASRTLTMTGDASLSGTNTGDQSIFQTVAVSGQSNVVADSTTDTLTLAQGPGAIITTNASTDTVTFDQNVGYTYAVAQGATGF